MSASLASAEPNKDAAKHFGEGLRLYAEKDYKAAAAELEISYNLNNDQTTLFAWAQAERLYGNCDKSKELLTTYIASGANAKQSKAAYDLMEQCTPRVVEPPPPVVTPPETGNTNGTANLGSDGNVSASQGNDTKHWYKDWVGITLLAVGGVGTTLGLLSYSDARADEKDAAKEGVTYDRFLHLRSEAEEKRTNAAILGIGGTVILGAAAVYILTDLVSGKDSKESAPEGMVMHLDGLGGGGISWAGQF